MKDSDKHLNGALEKQISENGELRRQNQMLLDKVKQLEF